MGLVASFSDVIRAFSVDSELWTPGVSSVAPFSDEISAWSSGVPVPQIMEKKWRCSACAIVE